MVNTNDGGASRRDFLGVAALAVAGAGLGIIDPIAPQRAFADRDSFDPRRAAATEPLGPVKQIDAGVLNVGYVEMGPASGRAVLLLHGWPYDIHSYDDVAPALAAKGY